MEDVKKINFFIRKFVIVIVLFMTLDCIAQNNTDKKVISSALDTIFNKPTGLSYPKNVREVIERLNSWDKKELDAYERKEAYPNYISSGETNGLVKSYKEILKKINIEIIWNWEIKKYELNPYQMCDDEPKLLKADLKKRIKNGMTLGKTIEILGLGWMPPYESIGYISWFFIDGSVLKVLPNAYNSAGIIKIINN